MARTLAELREDLARSVGRFFQGTTTSAAPAVGTVIDISRLEHFAEANALVGSVVYIRTTPGGGAPQGEWRNITAYVAATGTITVEYDWTVAPPQLSVYELYLANIPLYYWADCINLAIRDAWPELYDRILYGFDATGSTTYQMPSYAMGIEGVEVLPTGKLEGYPSQRLVRGIDWLQDGAAGSLYLVFQKRPGVGQWVRAWLKDQFEILSTDAGSTNLDVSYLLSMARSYWYNMMADAARGEADVAHFMSLVGFWRGEGEKRKVKLLEELLGGAGTGGAIGGGKK
jgi:hypothetical protein